MAQAFGKVGVHFAQADINYSSDTIRAVLLGAGWTPNIDTNEFWSAISTYEITATGYTAGGKTLATKTITYDTASNRTYLDCDPITWSSSTIDAEYIVFLKWTGTAGTSILMSYQSLTGSADSASGDFTFTPDANGILYLGV